MDRSKRKITHQKQDALPSSTRQKDGSATSSSSHIAGERLLILQMLLSTPNINVVTADGTQQDPINLQKLAEFATLAQYRHLKPRNSAQAMLASLSVQINNVTSDCLSEAVRTKAFPQIRDMNLKHGFRGALVLADLLERLERGRRDPTGVNIGNVNVESGGQAIVGHVESAARKRRKVKKSTPQGRTKTPRQAEE